MKLINNLFLSFIESVLTFVIASVVFAGLIMAINHSFIYYFIWSFCLVWLFTYFKQRITR